MKIYIVLETSVVNRHEYAVAAFFDENKAQERACQISCNAHRGEARVESVDVEYAE